MKRILAISAIILSATTAAAGEWVLGAGSSLFHDTGSQSGSIASFELHSAPFFTRNRFSLRYMGVVTGHATGDVFVGVGLSGVYDFDNRWYIEGSIAPGYFNESSPGNDLGSSFEIRSLLGLGYELNSGDSISLAVMHKSNASTASRNPGVNGVLLRYHHRF